jgi:glyoxylase-like metal-dependent hydrolase (beta-lactamase superfamily II)
MSEAVVLVTADADQFTCNAYLLLGETPTLVDAGTMPGVASVVADHTDTLDRVVLTHQHSDHVGRLDEVVDAFGPDVFAYADHPHRTEAIEDGDRVAMGDERFDVVYTPGHATDHVSLVSETRLFSGDVVVYNDGAYDDGSFGRTDMAGQSRERLITSLKALLERLPDSVTSMYAGHGDAFHAADHDDSVRDVVERALSRAELRQPKYPEE